MYVKLNLKIWNDMDLQQVVEVLEQHNKWRRDNNVPAKTKQVDPIILGKAIDIAVEELKQPIEERANVWISVEDELPPLEQPVWLFEKGRISIGFRTIFNMDGWFWATTYDYADYRPSIGWDMCPECDDDYKPTHWQSLPTPPKQQ